METSELELPVIESSVQMVTPSMAAEWSKHNVGHNRILRRRQITWLAQQMKRGRWLLTHQGIAFDTDGMLQDGQHRLAAILESGATIPLLVFRGISPDTFKVLDTGKVRSAGDVLHTAGITAYSVLIAGFTRMILGYKLQGDMSTKVRGIITNSMVLDFAQKHEATLVPVAAQYVRLAKETGGATLGISLASALHWVCGHTKGSNMETAGDFFEKIYTGADLHKSDPILHLRNWLQADRASDAKANFKMKYVMVVKAWNFWRSDTPVLKLWTYRGDEEIPIII